MLVGLLDRFISCCVGNLALISVCLLESSTFNLVPELER